MKTFTYEVANEIKDELESLPEKYANNFNSTHEGLAVIQEEFEELKDEVFFGEKRAYAEAKKIFFTREQLAEKTSQYHKLKLRKEAIQLAAMCVRFIQELT